jgi:hypothetical protein
MPKAEMELEFCEASFFVIGYFFITFINSISL